MIYDTKKYKHLSFEDKCIIEEFLIEKYNFTQIANRLGKDRTTISIEIRKHRFLIGTRCIQPCCYKSKTHMYVMDVLNLIIVEKLDIHITMRLLITSI